MNKKIVILIAVIFTSISSIASTTYVVEGRGSQLQTVTNFVSDLRLMNHPVQSQVNNNLGEYFNVTCITDGQIVATQRVHLSDKILAKYTTHRSNGRIGEQLLEVCGTQAYQIASVVRAGNKPVTKTEIKYVYKTDTLIQKQVVVQEKIVEVVKKDKNRWKKQLATHLLAYGGGVATGYLLNNKNTQNTKIVEVIKVVKETVQDHPIGYIPGDTPNPNGQSGNNGGGYIPGNTVDFGG